MFALCTQEWLSLGESTCGIAAGNGNLECFALCTMKTIVHGMNRPVVIQPKTEIRLFALLHMRMVVHGMKKTLRIAGGYKKWNCLQYAIDKCCPGGHNYKRYFEKNDKF